MESDIGLILRDCFPGQGRLENAERKQQVDDCVKGNSMWSMRGREKSPITILKPPGSLSMSLPSSTPTFSGVGHRAAQGNRMFPEMLSILEPEQKRMKAEGGSSPASSVRVGISQSHHITCQLSQRSTVIVLFIALLSGGGCPSWGQCLMVPSSLSRRAPFRGSE